jgi:hypothetical protein
MYLQSIKSDKHLTQVSLQVNFREKPTFRGFCAFIDIWTMENTQFFHLAQVGVAALAPCLWVGDDKPNTGEQLPALHEGEGVGRAALHQGHAVVAQRAQVHVHRRGVRRGRALNTHRIGINQKKVVN